MIHIATGNKLDVLYTFKDDRMVLVGLQRVGSDEVIPLPHPKGLLQVLREIVDEIERERACDRNRLKELPPPCAST